MNRFVTIVGITLILCAPASAQVTNSVVVPLTWVGRSTEASGTIAAGPTIGSAVAAGLALPLNPNQTIFDNGSYWPFSAPAGNQYATWRHYGTSWQSWEVRRFQATFTLPAELHDVVGFILFSPYYAAFGDLIPFNDNGYYYLNGTFIGAKGVDYGGTNAGVPINETDGWRANGNFGSVPVALLQPGLNVLDIVAEDRLISGGMGLVNLKLLDVIPEPNTVTLIAGAIALLACGLRRRLV